MFNTILTLILGYMHVVSCARNYESGVYFCAYVPEPTMREGTGIEAIKQQVRIATGCMYCNGDDS